MGDIISFDYDSEILKKMFYSDQIHQSQSIVSGEKYLVPPK